MFALSVNGVVYSTVVGLYLDSRCFQSEVSCEERETADIENLLQNVCFKTKKKARCYCECLERQAKCFLKMATDTIGPSLAL